MTNKLVLALVLCLVIGSVSVDAFSGYNDLFDSVWEGFKSFFWYGEPNNLVGYQTGGDGEFQTSCTDVDGDGYNGHHSFLCPDGDDCDDNDPTINPGALEICDGKDNDCDDETDESLTAPPCDNQEGVCSGSTKTCEGSAGWEDCSRTSYGPNYESPEITCGDGLDNDCDGANDCVDSDCVGKTGSKGENCEIPESTCNDGYDNDGDDLTDCADSDCDGNPAGPNGESCEHGVELNCGDGYDNDGDGDVDCADSDCVDDPACSISEDCSNGVDDDGDGDVDCLDTECNNLSPPVVTGYGYYTCCDDSSDCANLPGTDCDVGNTGSWNICYEDPSMGSCEDNVDNDGDGFVDCTLNNADWDCSNHISPTLDCTIHYGSTEFDCDDEYDNDMNFFKDCEDSQCVNDPACATGSTTSEDCSNGVDDDGDGFVDCMDYDCYYSSTCSGQASGGEDCSNGVDDDGDGLTDCADSDCASSSLCSVPSSTPPIPSSTPPPPESIPGLQVAEVFTAEQILNLNIRFTAIVPKLERLSNSLTELERAYKNGNQPLLRVKIGIYGKILDETIDKIKNLLDGKLNEKEYSLKTKAIRLEIKKFKGDLEQFLEEPASGETQES